MTALLSALGSGVSAKKILDYFMRKSPELAPKISSALAAGVSADQVVRFFSKDKNFEKLKGQLQNQYSTDFNANPLVQSETVRSQNLGSDMASGLQRQAPALLGGAAALGAGMALKHALPNPLKDPISKTIERTQETSQQKPPVLGNASLPQQTKTIQPEVIFNPKEYLEKKGLLDAVNASMQRGNDPLQIAAELGIKRTGKTDIDPELLKNIEEYAKQPKVDENTLEKHPNQGVVQPNSEISQGKNEVLKELKNEEGVKAPVKIEKNAVVASPNGVGTVKEIRNGQAIIDVDGKLHKVKEDELETSPIPEKDLSDLYDDLIKGIESETGEDVSRMVQWAGYNPESNTLQFLPHTGKLYTYSDISEDDAALLRDILSVRKTSGQNFIGAWKAGSKSPIGAALSKLIKKLQSERGGKGNEYEASYEPIYSAYEPAIQSKRKKKK